MNYENVLRMNLIVKTFPQFWCIDKSNFSKNKKCKKEISVLINESEALKNPKF